MKTIALAALCLATLLAPSLHAQIRDSALSQKEIEEVREARLDPVDCVLLYVKFLDLRVQEVQDLYAKPRRPGREQDTHDLLEQFTSIADELSDNLDDYGPVSYTHLDVYKRQVLLTWAGTCVETQTTLPGPTSVGVSIFYTEAYLKPGKR